MKRWLLLAAIVAGSLAHAGPAAAHAAYKASDPPNKGTVSEAPSSIWAEFTEPLAEGSYLRVYDPCGRRVDDGSTQILGYRMTIGSSGRAAGRYVVRFLALSDIDSHPVSGDFTFTATGGEACPQDEPQEPRDDTPGDAEEEPRDEGDAERTTTDSGPTTAGSERDDTGGEQGSRHGDHSRQRMAGKNEGGREAGRGRRSDETGGRPGGPGTVATSDSAARSLLDGIPWLWFAISLCISALVGMAGGKIYVDLTTPPRAD